MDDRHDHIVRYINENGFATPEDLAKNLRVAAITIRRDLIALEKAGHLKRVHGGAIPAADVQKITPIDLRFHQHPKEKQQIAAAAVSHIADGQTIFIDAGSTCGGVAEALPENKKLVVITHSLNVINLVRYRSGITLIALGGEYNRGLNAFIGPMAEQQLKTLHADRAFIGTSGIDIDNGCTDDALLELSIKSMMHKQARESYVLADASKFGHVKPYQSIPIEKIKNLITGRSVPAKTVADFQKKGVHVLKAN
jgi:DeoR/GlpR family transcriptional regulator of sugar metabolism